MSEKNGTVTCGVRSYTELASSSSARAWARGLVKSLCGFGRRFTARGSTAGGTVNIKGTGATSLKEIQLSSAAWWIFGCTLRAGPEKGRFSRFRV